MRTVETEGGRPTAPQNSSTDLGYLDPASRVRRSGNPPSLFKKNSRGLGTRVLEDGCVRIVPLRCFPWLRLTPCATGVEIKVIEEGDKKTYPSAGDEVVMHYTGTLKSTGAKFDSSVDRGKPFVCKIGIGQLIKGWDVGVPKMSLGEKAILDISSDFGYGSRGAGGKIPPNADLLFEVQLLGINGNMMPGAKAPSSSLPSCSIA